MRHWTCDFFFFCFCSGSSCRHWMSSSRRPLNRLTLLTWWRTSTSTCDPSRWLLSRLPVGVSLLWLILHIVTGSCGTQTTAGVPWGSCPGGVHTFSSQPIRSLRAWRTTWTAWSANWPKSCRWGVAKNLRMALEEIHVDCDVLVWPWLFCNAYRRTFLQKRSRQERMTTMTTETIFSKTAMTVSLWFASALSLYAVHLKLR